MDPSQPDLRQSAAEAFMASLDQLGHLQADEGVGSPDPAGDRSAKSFQVAEGDGIEVEALEEAVADIEQFMQTKNSGMGE